jgi:hypothetical protein
MVADEENCRTCCPDGWLGSLLGAPNAKGEHINRIGQNWSNTETIYSWEHSTSRVG